MFQPLLNVQKTDSSCKETSKISRIPKPISISNNLLINDTEKSKTGLIDDKVSDLELKHKGERITLDYHTTTKDLESILKSLTSLNTSKEFEGSNLQMNVNIFYKPVFNYNKKPQTFPDINEKLVDSNNGDFEINPNPTKIKPSNLANVQFTGSQNIFKNDNIKLVIPTKNNKNEETCQDFSNSYEFKKNSQASQPIKITLKSKNNDTNFKSKENLLRKRQKIENVCNCNKVKEHDAIRRNDPLLDQQIIKLKYFWRGSNPSYPFAFRKKKLKYYEDTDELSVDDIIDYSQKVIVTDEMPFRGF